MAISAKRPGLQLVAALTAANWLFCFVTNAGDTNTNATVIVSMAGTVEVQRKSSKDWIAAQVDTGLGTGDQLRTGQRSRATLRLSNLSVVRVGELLVYEIESPRDANGKPVINLKSGSAYFFSRDKPQEVQLRTPTVTGAIRGTEFNVTVEPDGRTTLTMIDGEVALSNNQGVLVLDAGEQGVAEAGRAPVRTAVLNAVNVIQWNLYYPGVLDIGELDLDAPERTALAPSLAAYQRGELLEALRQYPANRQPASAADHLYLGQLLLAVGLVDQTLPHLDAVTAGGGNNPALAKALRELIAAVKFEPRDSARAPTLATEFLAESYYQQSRGNLVAALTAARAAAAKSPSSGFAWERVAELEFSFGRTATALEALDKSLGLAPRNPQALALKGFLLSAQNRIAEATELFDEAIAIDGALANAWLGRGLCRIHRGQVEAGREDLEVAAALEPNRAVLRSYLGKAFGETHDHPRAEHELELAQKLDPNDPTSWLYSALLHQQQNRINEGIRDLEKSKALNDNRDLFRSRLLLDQDQAVRGANLAKIYQDNGMREVSVNEAARAVTADYANSSAHLFLSDAYNDLRDPTQFNLRYETVWFNELLLANALSPVGGGRLSQGLSQQEYSKLFAADGFGFSSVSDVRTDEMFHQQASQFGTFGNIAYSLDLDYHHNNGVRPNNSLDNLEWNTTIKHQFTPQDTAMLLVEYQRYHSGDNFQYYDPTNARPNYKFDEYQQPILVGLWHHEWSPGMHTLAMVSRLTAEQQFSDRAAPQLLLVEDATGAKVAASANPFDVNYHNDFEIYGGELNQIAQWERVTFVAGARYQSGSFHTRNLLDNPGPLAPLFNSPPANDSNDANFDRFSGYGYLTVEPLEKLWLTAGLAYDEVKFPSNFRAPPVSSGQEKRSQLGPKAALVWSPKPQATMRAFYAQSLGGVSLDESYRLEPTQLGGFPQAFRSLISESVVGSVAAPTYETFGLAFDLKLTPRTYLTMQGERLGTTVNRDIGTFTLEDGLAPFVPSATREHLDYEEYNLTVSLNQLLGDEFVLGASYKLIDADLRDTLTDVPVSALATAEQKVNSRLHQVAGYVLWNHPSGFFARADVKWYKQHNSGYATAMPGDDFFQENIYVGYRFADRRAELLLGLLNIGAGNYKLNPLTVYEELPRERVFQARFSFVF